MMRIISDTTEPLYESMESVMPYSHYGDQKWLAGLEGELKIELTDRELTELIKVTNDEDLTEWFDQHVDAYRNPTGIGHIKWSLECIQNNVVVLYSEEVEANDDQIGPEPEDKYDI